MADEALQGWMLALGYDPASRATHHPTSRMQASHPYAPELLDLLNPTGNIRAQAVFDVEGVPTVCFFVDDGSLLNDKDKLGRLRQQIWNQNLISLILIFTPQRAFPVPLTKREKLVPALERVDARPDGPLSCADVQSGDIWLRYKSWFRIEDRVDRTLLANLRLTVRDLSEADERSGKEALSTEDAQYLVAQILFISYLEDREILGEKYRSSRNVGVSSIW
jgi:hypothetical protein